MFGKKEDDIKITTLIGEGSRVGGDFSALGSARIDGYVGGDVSVEGTLIVGIGGVISGNVSAEAVVIGGEVQGNITAPKKAELTGTAKVLGNIATAVIVIDENAVFQGKCDMNHPDAESEEKVIDPKAANANRKSAKAALEEALREVREANQNDTQETESTKGVQEVPAEG